MKIYSRLPKDREQPGIVWWVKRSGVADGAREIIVGPYRARGEADNSGAAAHGNVQEDPARAYGDHPSGYYRVNRVADDPQPPRSYGPFFLGLDPVDGEALQAKRNGRVGLGIHGGDLGPEQILRPTFGCLRVDNQTIIDLAQDVQAELQAGRQVLYECELVES